MIKHKRPTGTTAHVIIHAVTVVAALAALLIAIEAHQQFTRSSYYSMKNDIQTSNEYSKLRFCYDNQIRPCDDVALREWNTAHPDNIFNGV